MDLLILGASARAAAHSAVRAGLRPAGVDLFADLDLSAVAPFARRVERRAYPDGLEAIAAEAPPSPWLYTGALENHPELVDRIARARPLWGNPGATLRAVRDPIAVAAALHRAGLAHPGVRRDPEGLPRDGSWLIKPLASAGGGRVRPLLPGPLPRGTPSYFQERIDGPSLGATFAGDRSGAALLGVTGQWIGRTGADFLYRGSLGPWPATGPERRRIGGMGRALASAFGLVGLFGVDFLLRDGEPYPVEVNPRYTASVDVLELALGRSLLAEHVRACAPEAAGGLHLPPAPTARPAVVGKAFLFAPSPCRFDGPAPAPPGSGYEVPRFADIPPAGSRFEAGEPVMTLYARGATLEECRRRLERRLATWTRRLGREGG